MSTLTKLIVSVSMLFTYGSLFGNSENSISSPKSIAETPRIDKEDLSYTPPEGWSENPAQKGYIGLYSKTISDAGAYKSTIQVKAGEGSIYIDSISLGEYREFLLHKLGSGSSAMKYYGIRSEQIVELNDGLKGLVFYADFKMNNEPFMHLHLIVSNKRNHYFFTYTDTKEEMERSGISSTAATVFKSFSEINLNGTQPSRFFLPIAIGGAIIGFLVSFIFIRKLSGSKYKSEEPESLEDLKLAEEKISEEKEIEELAQIESKRQLEPEPQDKETSEFDEESVEDVVLPDNLPELDENEDFDNWDTYSDKNTKSS